MLESELNRELIHLLHESRQITDALLRQLAHERDSDDLEAMNLLERLAQLDERRARVFDQMRTNVSSKRRREEERSIRQFVLRALDQVGGPQTTGFLEDYLYATELVEAKSRGMGALRRDEYRAWDRLRDRPRLAYIVPCLDVKGRSVARWIARSDWPLAARLVVEGAEELWKLDRIRALEEASRESDTQAEALFVPLIERYAREALGDEAVDELGAPEESAVHLVSAARKRTKALEPAVRKAQSELAERLADLPEEQRFWGTPGIGKGTSAADERGSDAYR